MPGLAFMALLLSLLFQPVYKSWKREKVREPEGDSRVSKGMGLQVCSLKAIKGIGVPGLEKHYLLLVYSLSSFPTQRLLMPFNGVEGALLEQEKGPGYCI